MLNKITLDDFKQLAAKHARVLVFQEILGDTITPIQAFHGLEAHMKGALLLESSEPGLYSFIGFNPIAQLNIKRNKQGEQKEETLTLIREFYQKNRAVSSQKLPGFVGGVAGFFSYEAAQLFETSLQRELSDDSFPDILLKAYQDHIIFDHKSGKITFATITSDYDQGLARLIQFQQAIADHTAPILSLSEITSQNIHESLSDEAYIAATLQAQEHIKAGDAFQIVLARTFSSPFKGKAFDVYRLLRLRNPSPYMFYLDHDDFIVCGASPEKMISVKNNIVQSCPLAGTRPRGQAYNDSLQAQDLLGDPKEIAEHMMLVDLARNDIGVVAKPGGVQVTAHKQIKHCSHVMHISSTVEAPLSEGKDALDALCATFPAGTLSGAPKIRAMQIVDDLEGRSRQLYGGTIGYIDAQGDFDSCIAIRMAVIKNNMAYVTAGAGITADSDPQKEADETRHKTRAVLEAIALAQQGAL